MREKEKKRWRTALRRRVPTAGASERVRQRTYFQTRVDMRTRPHPTTHLWFGRR